MGDDLMRNLFHSFTGGECLLNPDNETIRIHTYIRTKEADKAWHIHTIEFERGAQPGAGVLHIYLCLDCTNLILY